MSSLYFPLAALQSSDQMWGVAKKDFQTKFRVLGFFTFVLGKIVLELQQ